MDQETARRRGTAAGVGSVLIGGILPAWPDRAGSLVNVNGRDALRKGLGGPAARPGTRPAGRGPGAEHP